MITRSVLVVALVAFVSWVTAAESRAPGTDAFGDPLPKGAKYRLGTSRFTTPNRWIHQDAVIALHPDGQSYAVYDDDIVAAYSARSGQQLWQAEQKHDGWAPALVYRTDGRQLALVGGDTVAILDAATGKKASNASLPFSTPPDLVLSADFKVAACATQKEGVWAISVHDPASGEERAAFDLPDISVQALALSGDGRLLAVYGNSPEKDEKDETGQQKVAESGPSVQVWDTVTKKRVSRVSPRVPFRFDPPSNDALGPQRPDVTMKLSPDGSVLYTATKLGVEAWDTATGKRTRRFPGRSEARQSLWISPDGKRLAAVGERGAIDVWYTESGERLGAGQSPPAESWRLMTGGCGEPWIVVGSSEPVVALPADGAPPVVATLDANRVRVEPLAGARQTTPSLGHRAPVTHVAFSNDGKHATTIAGGQVLRWDAATGKLIGSPVEVPPTVRSLLQIQRGAANSVLSADARFLAVIPWTDESEDTVAKVFDLPTGRETISIPLPEELSGQPTLTLSRDGTRLVGSGTYEPETGPRSDVVVVWDVATGRVVFEQKAALGKDQEVRANQGVLSPDGTTLAWGLTRWKVATGGEGAWVTEWTRWDIATGKRLGRHEVAIGWYATWIQCGDHSIVTLDTEGRVVVIDLATGKVTKPLDLPAYPGRLLASADGKTVAAVYLPEFEEERMTNPARIIVCDTATGEARQLSDPVLEKTSAGLPVALSPDGKLLATGLSDTTTLLWEIAALPPATK